MPVSVAPEQIAPGVWRLTAPNPGPMTGPGTNSYIVGTGPCAIIDPGVADAAHLDALANTAPAPVAAVLISHAHPDHSGGANRLAARCAAPVRAHPTRLRGVRDDTLAVDTPIYDGDTLALGRITLAAIHTPGHAADHLCFHALGTGLLFAGDTVMADSTVVILAPDGDMGAYFESLERLARLDLTTIAPGHGRLLDDAAAELAAIVAHRRERERQVAAALAVDAPKSPRAIAAALYPELDAAMQAVAAAQVEAHLRRLVELGRAVADRGGWRAV